MLLGECGHRPDQNENRQQLEKTGEGSTDAGFPVHMKTALGRWDHCQPMHVHDPRLTDVETTAGS
jgi:hypothetical protein